MRYDTVTKSFRLLTEPASLKPERDEPAGARRGCFRLLTEPASLKREGRSAEAVIPLDVSGSSQSRPH